MIQVNPIGRPETTLSFNGTQEARQKGPTPLIDRRRRTLLLFFAAGGATALPRPAWAGDTRLFHDHGHGLAFTPDGRTLLAPSDRGVAAYENGRWRREAPEHIFSAFATAERGLFGSGHARRGTAAGRFGVARSSDGGRTWRVLGFGGDSAYYMLTAGYRSGALYLVAAGRDGAPHAGSLRATFDDGETWRSPGARGLDGEIHGLSAHPSAAGTLAAGTSRGLFVSRDGAESFALLDDAGPVTSLAFDLTGAWLRYARPQAGALLQTALNGSRRASLRIPRLDGDYVTCLAQNPLDVRVMAFATWRRSVYLTEDGGSRWRPIASRGVARPAGAASAATLPA